MSITIKQHEKIVNDLRDKSNIKIAHFKIQVGQEKAKLRKALRECKKEEKLRNREAALLVTTTAALKKFKKKNAELKTRIKRLGG